MKATSPVVLRGSEVAVDAATKLPAAAPADDHIRVSAWWSLTVLTFLYSISVMDRQVITLLVRDIRADLGITDFQIGLIHGAAFAIFYVSFGLIFGWAVDRFPKRPIIFLGVVFWSVAAAAGGLAHNLGQFLLARFAVGAGEASLNPAAFAIIADSFPRARQATAMSVFAAGGVLGGAAATAFGGWLIDFLPHMQHVLPGLQKLAPWRLIFILTGLPGLVVAFIIWTIPAPLRQPHVSETGGQSSGAIDFMLEHKRFFTGHFVGYGLLAASSAGVAAWLPTYMIREFALPVSIVAFNMAAIGSIFGIGGALLSGLVTDRWFASGRTDAHLRLYFGLAAVQIALVFGIAWTDSLPVLLALASAFFAMASFSGVAAAASQIATPSRFRGRVTATYLVCLNLLGMGLGPVLVGAFTTYVFGDDAKVGWAIAASSAILLPIAMLALASAMRPMRHAVAALREAG
jgi:MFS family permease